MIKIKPFIQITFIVNFDKCSSILRVIRCAVESEEAHVDVSSNMKMTLRQVGKKLF